MKCQCLIPPIVITGGFYPLHDNACRCHDMRCTWRFECDRWTQRDTGGPNTPHAKSMERVADLRRRADLLEARL